MYIYSFGLINMKELIERIWTSIAFHLKLMVECSTPDQQIGAKPNTCTYS